MTDLSNTELAETGGHLVERETLERYRTALDCGLNHGPWTRATCAAVLRTLDDALARLDAVTRERDEWKQETERGASANVELIRKRRAAEARLDAVTRERDEAEKWRKMFKADIERWIEAGRIVQAEVRQIKADRDRYRAALEHHADSCRLCWRLLNPDAAALASPQPAAARHECQRCGSDEWTNVDYSGCSECRESTDEPDNLGDQLAYHRQKVVDIERRLRADEGDRG